MLKGAPVSFTTPQGFAGELDMDKELDRMEGGGGRQQQAKGRPGERFTPRDKSKKRAQRDSKYGERCLVCTVLCCVGGGLRWGWSRERGQRDVQYGELVAALSLCVHCNAM